MLLSRPKLIKTFNGKLIKFITLFLLLNVQIINYYEISVLIFIIKLKSYDGIIK